MFFRAISTMTIFASLMTFSLAASASHHGGGEDTIGGFVGLASNKYRVSSDVSGFSGSVSGSSSSFILGATYERELHFGMENLYLQLDPTWHKRGSNAPTYLDIPVLAKYKHPEELLERTYISGLAGVTPGLKISSGNFVGADVKSFSLGLEFGAELEHHLENNDYILFFGIRYNLGLTDMFSQSEIDENITASSSTKVSPLKFMVGARTTF